MLTSKRIKDRLSELSMADRKSIIFCGAPSGQNRLNKKTRPGTPSRPSKQTAKSFDYRRLDRNFLAEEYSKVLSKLPIVRDDATFGSKNGESFHT